MPTSCTRACPRKARLVWPSGSTPTFSWNPVDESTSGPRSSDRFSSAALSLVVSGSSSGPITSSSIASSWCVVLWAAMTACSASMTCALQPPSSRTSSSHSDSCRTSFPASRCARGKASRCALDNRPHPLRPDSPSQASTVCTRTWTTRCAWSTFTGSFLARSSSRAASRLFVTRSTSSWLFHSTALVNSPSRRDNVCSKRS